MAIEKINWKPSRDDKFDGIVDHREELDLLPADTAQGSIILIRAEEAYVIKDSKGQWRTVPPFPFREAEK